MHTFLEYLELRDDMVNEGWLQNVALAGAIGMGSMMGNTQSLAQTPVQTMQQKEIKQIDKNTYEVIGMGRISKISNSAYDQAKNDATSKLFKYLKIQKANISAEPIEKISDDGKTIVIKYKITLK